MAQMDADTQPSIHQHQHQHQHQHSTSASSSAASPRPPTPAAYRIFLGDTQGALKIFHAPCVDPNASLPDTFQPSLPRTVEIIPEQSHHSSKSAELRAVQKMASGHLDGVGWVIAIARKDATIDVILPPTIDDQTHQDPVLPPSPSQQQQQQKAVLLASIPNDMMKAGLQRWVGLAVGTQGIYAATSAGHFIYASLAPDPDATSVSSSSSTCLKLQISTLQRLTLPEPLQTLVFHPATDPTHFLYGGEEIPLSLWHLQTALSPHNGSNGDTGEGDQMTEKGAAVHVYGRGNGDDGNGMNAKLRKRKRQAEARAKAKELLWGEVWRAKNLPNDVLSLPQRPNILSICVLPEINASRDSSSSSSQSGDVSSAIPALTVVVGTRDGLIRTFEPASGTRRHTKETRVVLPGQGALKFLICSQVSEGEVVAADSAGKLYAVDIAGETGRVKYQWKDITGAITSAVPLPAPRFSSATATAEPGSEDSPPLLFTSSFDRLLRLHTLPSEPHHLIKGYHARGKNLYSTFTGGPGVVAAVWDGVIPHLPEIVQGEGDGDESMRSNRSGRNGHGRGHRHGHGEDRDGGGEAGSEGEEEEDEDENDVWQAMQEVGATETSLSSSSAAAAAAAAAAAGDREEEQSTRPIGEVSVNDSKTDTSNGFDLGRQNLRHAKEVGSGGDGGDGGGGKKGRVVKSKSKSTLGLDSDEEEDQEKIKEARSKRGRGTAATAGAGAV